MKVALILLMLYLLTMLSLGDGKRRLSTLLTNMDAFIFCLLCLGNTKQGECASSAAWDCLLADKWQGIFVGWINWLFMDPDHCRRSWEWQNHLYRESPWQKN